MAYQAWQEYQRMGGTDRNEIEMNHKRYQYICEDLSNLQNRAKGVCKIKKKTKIKFEIYDEWQEKQDRIRDGLCIHCGMKIKEEFLYHSMGKVSISNKEAQKRHMCERCYGEAMRNSFKK
jgi:hypothetical protein